MRITVRVVNSWSDLRGSQPHEILNETSHPARAYVRVVLNVQWQSAGPYPCFAAKRTARDNSRHHAQARDGGERGADLEADLWRRRAAAYRARDAHPSGAAPHAPLRSRACGS